MQNDSKLKIGFVSVGKWKNEIKNAGERSLGTKQLCQFRVNMYLMKIKNK